MHRLFDRSAAEDVTSTVFLQAIEHFSSFQGSDQGFRNWVYKIATNVINLHLRNAARTKTLLETDTDVISHPYDDGDRLVDNRAGALADVKRAILTLKPEYQAIIALRFFETMDFDDIAEILSSSPATVRSQLSRALTRLRKEMGIVADRSRPGG